MPFPFIHSFIEMAPCTCRFAVLIALFRGPFRSFLFSWGTADVDRKPWNVTFKGDVVLPTVDFSGDFIASDGLVLVGYGSTGTPFGEPITLFPVNGQLFDMTLVASKVVLLYKCGFLVTYLTSEF